MHPTVDRQMSLSMDESESGKKTLLDRPQSPAGSALVNPGGARKRPACLSLYRDGNRTMEQPIAASKERANMISAPMVPVSGGTVSTGQKGGLSSVSENAITLMTGSRNHSGRRTRKGIVPDKLESVALLETDEEHEDKLNFDLTGNHSNRNKDNTDLPTAKSVGNSMLPNSVGTIGLGKKINVSTSLGKTTENALQPPFVDTCTVDIEQPVNNEGNEEPVTSETGTITWNKLGSKSNLVKNRRTYTRGHVLPDVAEDFNEPENLQVIYKCSTTAQMHAIDEAEEIQPVGKSESPKVAHNIYAFGENVAPKRTSIGVSQKHRRTKGSPPSLQEEEEEPVVKPSVVVTEGPVQNKSNSIIPVDNHLIQESCEEVKNWWRAQLSYSPVSSPPAGSAVTPTRNVPVLFSPATKTSTVTSTGNSSWVKTDTVVTIPGAVTHGRTKMGNSSGHSPVIAPPTGKRRTFTSSTIGRRSQVARGNTLLGTCIDEDVDSDVQVDETEGLFSMRKCASRI